MLSISYTPARQDYIQVLLSEDLLKNSYDPGNDLSEISLHIFVCDAVLRKDCQKGAFVGAF